MKLVKESLNEFGVGNNPLSTMGLGNINRTDFENDKDFGDWFYSVLPDILGTNEIPDDFLIIGENEYYTDVQYKYWDKINRFMIMKGLAHKWYDSEDSYPYLINLLNKKED